MLKSTSFHPSLLVVLLHLGAAIPASAQEPEDVADPEPGAVAEDPVAPILAPPPTTPRPLPATTVASSAESADPGATLPVVARPLLLPAAAMEMDAAIDMVMVDDVVDLGELVFLDLGGRISVGSRVELGIAADLVVKDESGELPVLERLAASVRTGGSRGVLAASFAMHTPLGMGEEEFKTLDFAGGYEMQRLLNPRVGFQGRAGLRFLNTLVAEPLDEAVWQLQGRAGGELIIQAMPELALAGGLELAVPLSSSPDELQDDAETGFNLDVGVIYSASPRVDLYGTLDVLTGAQYPQPIDLLINQRRLVVGVRSRL